MKTVFTRAIRRQAKTYRYRIYRDDICPPFLARYVYHDPYPMDEEAMIRASEYIVGTFDFTSFAASDPERSARIAESAEARVGERPGASGVGREHELDDVLTNVGTQSLGPTDDEDAHRRSEPEDRATCAPCTRRCGRAPHEEFSYTIRGNGFLHHMVRNLVGTFLQVGKGSLKPEDIPAILAARNRSAAGATAPACGLYLVSVEYGMS